MASTTQQYGLLIRAVIRAQEKIIGPQSTEIAKKIDGVLTSPSKEALGNLTKRYEDMFGLASVETCKEAIKPVLASEGNIDLPDILK